MPTFEITPKLLTSSQLSEIRDRASKANDMPGRGWASMATLDRKALLEHVAALEDQKALKAKA